MTTSREVRGAHPQGIILGGRYKIERALGRGGFAVTYLCRSGQYDKPYAVKEFLPTSLAVREADGTVHPISEAERELFDRGRADFIEEGKRLLQCRHENIVEVEDFFEEFGTAYLVMQYVEGDTLHQHLAKHQALTGDEILRLLIPITTALDIVHQSGLLHRDLSPNNIILKGGIDHPVLIDFGAARQATGIRSYSIANVCSDGYSPPEQYEAIDHQTPSSDIYALGCIAYRCLTGERVPTSYTRRDRDNISGWGDRFAGTRESLLVPIISKTISLEPALRYQSAEELRKEFFSVRAVWEVLDQLKNDSATEAVTHRFTKLGSIEISGDTAQTAKVNEIVSALRASAPNFDIRSSLEKETRKISATESSAQSPDLKPDATANEEPVDPEPVHSGGVAEQHGKTRFSRPLAAAIAATAVLITLAYTAWQFTDTSSSIAATEAGADQSGVPPEPQKSPADSPFKLQLELPKKTFKIGESFSFAVTANKECEFLVFTVGADDKVQVHWPEKNAQFMGSKWIKAGERRQIPIPGGGRVAKIDPPPGTYQMGAVCGREDLSKLGITEFEAKVPASRGKRNFNFYVEDVWNKIDKAKLAQTTVTYEVLP